MIKLVNKQKSKWLIGLLLIWSHWAVAQQSNSLTLDSCLEMAKQNYPLIKQ